MTLLADKELKEAVRKGEIKIVPELTEFEPASIDLHLGKEAFRSKDDEVLKLEEGKILILPPGDFALVITQEYLKLSRSIVGHIGLRSKYTRQGVILLAGPQIDPGFEGVLHVVLCNLSPSEITLSFGESFCTVEFHKLSHPAKAYGGKYLGQESITADEIRDIREKRGLALSEALELLTATSRNVSELSSTVKKLSTQVNRYMGIFTSAIIALVIGILGKLGGFW